MRPMYRREKHQLVFGGSVAVAGVVALLFFLILYLPSRSEYRAVGESIERLEAETAARKVVLESLEDAAGEFDLARGEWSRFLGARLIPRESGFAAMIPDLERLAGIAGVSRDRVAYNTSQETQFGLYAVIVNMPVRSTYASLTRFIEALEDADIFLILDSIYLGRTEDEEQGDLDLTLNLTTFFSREP